MASQTPFCMFIQRVLNNAKDCKWKVALADWPGVKARERPGQLFALVRTAELGVGAFAHHKNTFTIETFVSRISSVDVQNSLSGLR